MEMFHKVHKSVKKHDLSVKGVSRELLVVIDGIMNKESYLNLLKNVILPKIRLENTKNLFMQENAPCHTARLVKDFLAQQNVQCFLGQRNDLIWTR